MPVAVPVYIPYPIGYAPEELEKTQDEGDAAAEYAYDSSQEPSEPGNVTASGTDGEAPAEENENAAEAPQPSEEPVVAQPSTVLVYKDGHRTEVVNYAILGDALFDFDDEHTRKIPLADLDLAATGKANDVRGVDFTLPPGSSGGSAP